MFIVDLRNASFRQPGLQSVPQRVRKQIIFCETKSEFHQYDADLSVYRFKSVFQECPHLEHL